MVMFKLLELFFYTVTGLFTGFGLIKEYWQDIDWLEKVL